MQQKENEKEKYKVETLFSLQTCFKGHYPFLNQQILHLKANETNKGYRRIHQTQGTHIYK